MLLHAAALALLAQDDQTPPPEGPPPRPVNRVEMIVNSDLITRRALSRELAKRREEETVSTDEEDMALRIQIFRAALEELLLRQAGEDLGQPKEAVARVLDNVWQSQIERSGGVREFSLEVEGEEQTSLEKRQKLEDDLYMYTYTRVVTGREPGQDGRVIADRYIRPGTRRRLYDYMERTGDGLREIDGTPRTIVMQQLVQAVDEGLEPEARREALLALRSEVRELRRRAFGGEDFYSLVNQFGVLKGPDSLSGEVHVDRLRGPFPGLAEFAAQAEVGDLSPVLPVRGVNGQVEGWRLVRILETTPGQAPPFLDVEVQRTLERLAQYQLDQRRRAVAIEKLVQSAYVWNPDLERAEAERAAREAEALAEQP